MPDGESNLSLERGSNEADARLSAFRACCAAEPRRVEISEWLLSIALTVVGVHILLYPQAIAASHMLAINDTVPVWALAIGCLWLGLTRLVMAGQRNVTRRVLCIRAGLAVVGAAIWLEMATAFAWRFIGLVPPPGLDMLLIVQVCGELWLVFRIKSHAAHLRRKGLIQ